MDAILVEDALWLPAAVADGATARPLWDITTATDNPTPAVVAGSNQRYGVLNLTDAQLAAVRKTILMPRNWYPAAGLGLRIHWSTPAESPLQVELAIRTAFAIANDEADSYSGLDPAYNTAQMFTQVASTDAAYPLKTLVADALTLDLPDAVALSGIQQALLFLKISRDPGAGADDLGDTCSFLGAELIFSRLLTALVLP